MLVKDNGENEDNERKNRKRQLQTCDKKDLRRMTKPQKQAERLRPMNRDRLRVNETMKERIKTSSGREKRKKKPKMEK